MLNTPIKQTELDLELVTNCINACNECASMSNFCVETCLSEDMTQTYAKCVLSNMNCSDICLTTSRILSRKTQANAAFLRAQIYACAEICRLSAEDCQPHGHLQPCGLCVQTCRQCEDACRDLLNALPY